MYSTLLVLQDSPHFGGHEIMFLKLLPAALEGAFDRIVVRMPERNAELRGKLEAIGSPKLPFS